MDQPTPRIVPFPASRQPCPFERFVDIFSGTWTPRILWLLLDGATYRFAEIQRIVEPVSSKVLTERLRYLEQQRLVKRIARKSATPYVEYMITDRGKLLEPVFHAMAQISDQLFGDELSSQDVNQ
ncbi:transcriptional regulator [Burkholderia savannae]|uniref:winged helix-turn-helix transcriptional regulator n=1 Tax=Burkholderia savannae TaxID=1637837 RepID=UPI000763D234|nr:helix-turn-helix domain-containing protein [Burkholderia savannae]AOJ82181.1 transcriptional regulator [Burkholderia savannae]KWZ40475.1 transcriptional regulator [Burkholderia savannae]